MDTYRVIALCDDTIMLTFDAKSDEAAAKITAAERDLRGIGYQTSRFEKGKHGGWIETQFIPNGN